MAAVPSRRSFTGSGPHLLELRPRLGRHVPDDSITAHMESFYHRVFEALPIFLQRRIHPLEFSLQEFMAAAARAGHRVVLDAGAGESRFRTLFQGCRYIAVDLGVGDHTWDYSGLDLRANLSALPVRSASVDAVLNTQVLEHVTDPAAVLVELARVLKPGGVLYLTAPQGWHEHQQPHDYFRFTRFALERMLAAAGFDRWEMEPMGGYFWYLGHRLTYIPKVLFQDLRGWRRVACFPLELAALAVFCFFAPLLCTFLDGLDRQREFTLCYRVRAVRAFGQAGQAGDATGGTLAASDRLSRERGRTGFDGSN